MAPSLPPAPRVAAQALHQLDPQPDSGIWAVPCAPMSTRGRSPLLWRSATSGRSAARPRLELVTRTWPERGAVGPARWAVSAHFLVMGLTGGVWMARIPAAKAQAHLSDGILGIALFAVPAGLVIGAALAERLVDRVGSALLVRIFGVGGCAAAVTPGLAHTLPELMAALFAIGVFGGTLDVVAERTGRPGRGRLRPAGDDVDARLLQPRRDPRLAGRGWPRLGRRRAAPLAGRRRRPRRPHRRHRGPLAPPG